MVDRRLGGLVVGYCLPELLAECYRAQTGARHLDVGPGTGYFLDVAKLPEGTAITLLDPNPEVLGHAAQRLVRHAPATIRADACESLPLTGPFESAALNLVLHCIDGTERKAEAVATSRRPLTGAGCCSAHRCWAHRTCAARRGGRVHGPAAQASDAQQLMVVVGPRGEVPHRSTIRAADLLRDHLDAEPTADQRPSSAPASSD